MDVKRIVLWIVVGVLLILLGACGAVGGRVGLAMYDDHVLLNEIRAQRQQQLIDAANRVQQYQQQQQSAVPAAPPPVPAK